MMMDLTKWTGDRKWVYTEAREIDYWKWALEEGRVRGAEEYLANQNKNK